MANLEAIRAADFVMANLNDFRGPGEPDSGTAFEVGFAAALGKPVWGYRTSPHPLTETVPRTTDADEDTSVCTRGYLVKDFGLSVNLMLACAARIIAGGPAECLDAMKAALAAEDPLSLVTGLAKRSLRWAFCGSPTSVYRVHELRHLANRARGGVRSVATCGGNWCRPARDRRAVDRAAPLDVFP